MNFSKVMLIDDNDLDNYVNKKIMEKAEFAETFMVHNKAEQALKFLRENAKNALELPEIIFLDINMPQMNGWDFLKEFSSLPADVTGLCPVVMLTSSIDPIDYQRSKAYPSVFDYIKKPLNRETLNTITIENIFAEK